MTRPIPPDSSAVEITGGAGPEEAAAIVAMISQLRSVEEGR